MLSFTLMCFVVSWLVGISLTRRVHSRRKAWVGVISLLLLFLTDTLLWSWFGQHRCQPACFRFDPSPRLDNWCRYRLGLAHQLGLSYQYLRQTFLLLVTVRSVLRCPYRPNPQPNFYILGEHHRASDRSQSANRPALHTVITMRLNWLSTFEPHLLSDSCRQ